MDQKALTLEAAVAKIEATRQQENEQQEQERATDNATRTVATLANFEARFADALPIMATSGITYEVIPTESEDAYCAIQFTRDGRKSRAFEVTNNGPKTFAFDFRDLDGEGFLLALHASLQPDADKPNADKPAISDEERQQWKINNSAKQGAFARPIGNNGSEHYEDRDVSQEEFGLTKLEYFTAAVLQGYCANPNAGGPIEDFAHNTVKQAKAAIAALAADE